MSGHVESNGGSLVFRNSPNMDRDTVVRSRAPNCAWRASAESAVMSFSTPRAAQSACPAATASVAPSEPPSTPQATNDETPAMDIGALTDLVVRTAMDLRGVPYLNGGSDLRGFDCSGFTQYVFGQYGVALPRAVVEQFKAGQAVAPLDVARGDLLFFSTVAPGPTHVAIALGGDEFVHAPSSTGVVRVERLSASYWSQRFIGARRVAN